MQGGRDLLSVLNGAEIYVPSLCAGQGTCGYCKLTVPSGGGPVLPTELLYLTESEVHSGTRLACQLKVAEDLRIQLPSAFLSARCYRAKVCSVLVLTPSVKEIRLRLDDPERMNFSPGQYIQVEVPVERGEPVFRAYSLASPVYETAEVALNVQRLPGGVGSTYLHGLEVGDTVQFTGPYGEFQLDEDPTVEVVCVAGGCGLAPMKSIVYSTLARWPERICWLFYGCRTRAEAFNIPVYVRLAQQYPNFHFVWAGSETEDVPSEKGQGPFFETGPIHQSVERHLSSGPQRQAYLCGPPRMLETLTEVWSEKGADEVCFDIL